MIRLVRNYSPKQPNDEDAKECPLIGEEPQVDSSREHGTGIVDSFADGMDDAKSSIEELGKADHDWEHPCNFVTLRPGKHAISEVVDVLGVAL